jgi:ATP-dependent Zn protease
MVMCEILHVKAIWDAVFTGPLSANFFSMLRAHTLVFTDKMVAEIRPIAIAALGAEKFAQMKEDIAQKVIDKLPSIIDQSYAYTQEALDMENTVREKMQELTPKEFEGVL